MCVCMHACMNVSPNHALLLIHRPHPYAYPPTPACFKSLKWNYFWTNWDNLILFADLLSMGGFMGWWVDGWGHVMWFCLHIYDLWRYCHGMTESVKVHRKDQLVKDFTSDCLFLLFWLISCISLIFLIEIWSFCTNLLKNYPSHKIDQLPLLRILSLCMDHSMQTRIISLYLFLLFLFTPLALARMM